MNSVLYHPLYGSGLSASECLQKMKTAGYNYADIHNSRIQFAKIMFSYMVSLDFLCTSITLLHGDKGSALWHVDLATGNVKESVEVYMYKYNNDPEKSYLDKNKLVRSYYYLTSDAKEEQAKFTKLAQQAAKYKNWFRPEWLREQIWRIYDVEEDIRGSIAVWIARNIGLELNEAGTYINRWSGEFRPGKWMPHCLDPKLKELFAAFKAQYNKIQSDNRWVLRFADEDYEKAKSQLNSAIQEYKKVAGEEGSKPARLALKAELVKRMGLK